MKPATGDMTVHTASADPQIVQMATGHLVSQALFVIAELGIADHLKAGPRTAAALAEKTGTDASSLHRLLRTLTGLGLFTQGPDGAFATTPLGDSLRSDSPGCARAMVRMIAGPTMSRACGELLHAVKTGTSAFDKAIGQPVFGYLAQHADEAATALRGPWS